jgi:DNA processing protein
MASVSLEELVLGLIATKGVGPAKIASILDRANSIAEIRVDDIVDSGLLADTLSHEQFAAWTSGQNEAARQADALKEAGIGIITRFDSNYPSRLKTVLAKQAPPVLFVRGNQSLLNAPGVGFCGSRKASDRGLSAAADCADQLAISHINVVSGNATGVDSETHISALKAGGTTTLVIPEGILRHRIRNSLANVWDDNRALVVSEFPPNLSWNVSSAMKRNQTICGLSAAMILIEAGETGGSIQAGRECLRLSIPLFAAVYEGMPPFATGNQLLLEQGAYPLKRNRETGRAQLNAVFAAVSEALAIGKPQAELLFDRDRTH